MRQLTPRELIDILQEAVKLFPPPFKFSAGDRVVGTRPEDHTPEEWARFHEARADRIAFIQALREEVQA